MDRKGLPICKEKLRIRRANKQSIGCENDLSDRGERLIRSLDKQTLQRYKKATKYAYVCDVLRIALWHKYLDRRDGFQL